MPHRLLKPVAGRHVLYVMAAEPEYGPHLQSRFTPLVTGVGPVEAGTRMGVALARLEARLVDLCTTRYLSELPPHGLCEAQRLASLALHHGCCCSAHLLHHGMQRLNLRAQALDRGFGGGQLRAQRAHLGGRVFSVALDALTALAQ